MERLTSPNINVNPDTDRFLHAAIGGKEIDWKQSRDSTLNVLINGPTSNGFGKDIFRKMARDLYGRLKAYEDSGCEPEEVLPKGKAGEIALNLMRLAGLESLCSYDRLRELAEADEDMTAAQLYFYQWQAAFNQLTQAISHIKDEDKAGKLCAAIRAQLAAWGKTMEDTQ